MCKLGVMYQERFKIEVKLLLSANMKSYMLRRLAQQPMTFSDLERPFHGLRGISAVAELLVLLLCMRQCACGRFNVNNFPGSDTLNPHAKGSTPIGSTPARPAGVQSDRLER